MIMMNDAYFTPNEAKLSIRNLLNEIYKNWNDFFNEHGLEKSTVETAEVPTSNLLLLL